MVNGSRITSLRLFFFDAFISSKGLSGNILAELIGIMTSKSHLLYTYTIIFCKSLQKSHPL